MTTREHDVLSLIRDDPMLPQQAIAERLGISRSAVAGHIMNLCNKGLIKGRGYVLGDSTFAAVIGGASIDIHGRSVNTLRGKDSNPGTVHASAGGVARNVAENLARLGVDVRLITAIGSDHHGQMLMRLSREAGIDMQHVHEFASAPTSTYLSVLDDGGEMQVAIADMSIMDKLRAERLKPQRAMLQQASLIILDTNLPDDALAWLCTSFSKATIFADTVSSSKALRIKPHLSTIHTLKMSEREAETLTGCNARTQKQLFRLADQLRDEGVNRVFITRGDKGVLYSSGETNDAAPARSKNNIRSTAGAGDAFLAGLAYAWLDELPLDESVRVALTAADITLSHASTNSPALSLTAIKRALEN